MLKCAKKHLSKLLRAPSKLEVLPGRGCHVDLPRGLGQLSLRKYQRIKETVRLLSLSLCILEEPEILHTVVEGLASLPLVWLFLLGMRVCMQPGRVFSYFFACVAEGSRCKRWGPGVGEFPGIALCSQSVRKRSKARKCPRESSCTWGIRSSHQKCRPSRGRCSSWLLQVRHPPNCHHFWTIVASKVQTDMRMRHVGGAILAIVAVKAWFVVHAGVNGEHRKAVLDSGLCESEEGEW